MNGALPAAIGGILRHILGAVATALVTYGLLDTGATEEFIGAAMFLVTLGWSAWQKIQAARALDDAIAAPAGLAKAVPLGDSRSGARLRAHPLAVVGAVLLLALLAGCSADRVYGTAGAIITADPELKAFTLADIKVASDMAHAQNDTLAYTCYDFLLARLPEMGIGLDTPAPQVMGAFSAFQRARSGVKAANTGVSDEFKVACYPLIMDAKEDIQSVGRALGRLVGGGVLTGGLAPAAAIGGIAGASAASAAAAAP